MSNTLKQVQALVARGEVRVSLHGYEGLAADAIRVLVLERDRDGRPIHVVWGIPGGQGSPAGLITGYRPDPEKRWMLSSWRLREPGRRTCPWKTRTS
ncbi:MAG: DUF4258 domain-containing protein [Armatimonadetes bacterium]|nr:DUF4258 domain-containing protein [Armatimonadota bacterium]